MPERGLIFDGALVPGVMAGTVTVTSRVMNPQPQTFGDNDGRLLRIVPSLLGDHGLWDCQYDLDNPKVLRCPFRVGERRYVKEVWQAFEPGTSKPLSNDLVRQPTICSLGYRSGEVDRARENDDIPYFGPWRSPMLMPRRFARTWIEILAVRPARCQEITYSEILASGFRRQFLTDEAQTDASHMADARAAYAALWDRLNKARGYPWIANHWVWRVTFRTVTP